MAKASNPSVPKKETVPIPQWTAESLARDIVAKIAEEHKADGSPFGKHSANDAFDSVLSHLESYLASDPAKRLGVDNVTESGIQSDMRVNAFSFALYGLLPPGREAGRYGMICAAVRTAMGADGAALNALDQKVEKVLHAIEPWCGGATARAIRDRGDSFRSYLREYLATKPLDRARQRHGPDAQITLEWFTNDMHALKMCCAVENMTLCQQSSAEIRQVIWRNCLKPDDEPVKA